MDERQYLILVKGEDKTSQIQHYDYQGTSVSVTYKGSTKTYEYAIRNFTILDNPKLTDIADQNVVYLETIPLNDVLQVIDFGPKVRIMFRYQKSQVYDADWVRVESNSLAKPSAKKIMQFWADISHHVSLSQEQGENGSFLKKQFENLRFVSPSSVLGVYIDGISPRVETQSASQTIFPFKFNLSQRQALDNALRSQISIIEGPPGTGKTQTILNILANLILQNKKVAVVAGNNAAVQNVQDKLKKEGYGFLVAALGNNENKQRFFVDPPAHDVSAWKTDVQESELFSQITDLNDRIHHLMAVEREMAQLQRQLSAYKLEQEHFEAYYTKQGVQPMGKLSLYRLTPERILAFMTENHMASERGKTGSILYKIKLLIQYGFTRLNRISNQAMTVVLSFQRKYYELKVQQIKQRIASLQTKLTQGSFETLLSQHQQISQSLFRQWLYQKYHAQESIQVDSYSYKKVFHKFIEQYPIMLSTAHSLRNCIPENFLFDYVIIDESSQVDLLTGALALSSCRNVIIVGDTKQLPHIVDTGIQKQIRMDETLVGGAYDYFKHNLLSSMFDLYGKAIPHVVLKEHYRCQPRIIEFCNQKYYDGQLIPFTTEEPGDNPMLVYRTAPGNHMSELNHGQKGRFNQRELDVIEHEILRRFGSAVQSDSGIGITTPFRKQVEKASDQLGGTIEIDTIHKYQGREKPIMVLSTVLDSSSNQRLRGFVNDPSMINVAVSRAQQKFIVVTDHSLFRDYDSEIGDLIRYIEYGTLDNNVIDSEIVSVFDLLYKEYSERLRGFKNRVKRQSKYLSEDIISTLIGEVLQDSRYNGIDYRDQVFLKNLFSDLGKLGDEARSYVNNGASVDFVLYNKLDKSPVLAIEVDGFAFHENSERQAERDRLKDCIFRTYGLPLLRLPTTGSEEEQRIRVKLDEIVIRLH